jgi:hypothetical protein
MNMKRICIKTISQYYTHFKCDYSSLIVALSPHPVGMVQCEIEYKINLSIANVKRFPPELYYLYQITNHIVYARGDTVQG